MPDHSLGRRQVLALGGGVIATALHSRTRAAELEPSSPTRGGILTVRAWDPPNFDLQMFDSYKTHILYSFTHSRLLRHLPGPSVPPGVFPIEGDLAESWSQPSETVYRFTLRRGVRWHNKPPVNGRELTAEDVTYSARRAFGGPRRRIGSLPAYLHHVEAPDRYTVVFTLNRPLSWLPDIVASPMVFPIIARECVETFGDLQKVESMVGTGPWQLESYHRGVGITLRRHPGYFRSGLPYIDRINLVLDDDSTRVAAAFVAGKYDIGWDPPGVIPRSDWSQLRDRLRAQRPSLRTTEILDSALFVVVMRSDRPPFDDVRVRQAISMAVNRREIVESVFEGEAAINPPVQAALREWSLPVEQLGPGTAFYRHDPTEARRLLAEAGHAGGFEVPILFSTYGRAYNDMLQLVVRDLKAVGITTRPQSKEYGAFVSTVPFGQFEGLALAGFPSASQPFSSLLLRHYPGQAPNAAHVDDSALTPMIDQLAAAREQPRRRALLSAIQRHLAVQQYYVHLPSGIHVAAWDSALKNYAPNMSYDYGGRLTAAWLDR